MSTSGIIYVSPVIFTTEQINKINQEINKRISNNTLEALSAPAPGKMATIHKIPCMDMMEFVYPFISEMRKVNMDLFGYDAYFYLESDSFNYNVYKSETKDEYYWHTDGTEFGEASDIKLTGILNLSQDSYEGGDFLIFPHYQDTESKEYKDVLGKFHTPGTIAIFNSTIPHRVLPVVKGKRITLSYWAHGPRWK